MTTGMASKQTEAITKALRMLDLETRHYDITGRGKRFLLDAQGEASKAIAAYRAARRAGEVV